MQTYSDENRREDPYSLPDIEIFEIENDDNAWPEYESGFYWWTCLPGCLPDSDEPNGPFETWEEAQYDAQDI